MSLSTVICTCNDGVVSVTLKTLAESNASLFTATALCLILYPSDLIVFPFKKLRLDAGRVAVCVYSERDLARLLHLLATCTQPRKLRAGMCECCASAAHTAGGRRRKGRERAGEAVAECRAGRKVAVGAGQR
jgi:hypothetical protein